MLNRKLHRAGLLSFGFLVIAAGNVAQSVDSSRNAVLGLQYPGIADTVLEVLPLPANTPAINLNRQAEKYVKKYLKDYSYTLEVVKKRSENYFPLLDSILTLQELPVELKYMAVVESNLKPVAKSKVGARGMWQLMPVTARNLGLKVKKSYDERINVSKSTVAASIFMKELYNEFGDWLLVIAAYNAGSGSVRKAIRKSGSRNFWQLQNFLPLETRNHVKRYIGVHVYFEGKGGLTTLTKKETEQHNKLVAEFNARQAASEVTVMENDVVNQR